jgi:hypothetical protein
MKLLLYKQKCALHDETQWPISYKLYREYIHFLESTY